MVNIRTEPKDIITLIEGSDYSSRELKDLLNHIFFLYESKKELEMLRLIKQTLNKK